MLLLLIAAAFLLTQTTGYMLAPPVPRVVESVMAKVSDSEEEDVEKQQPIPRKPAASAEDAEQQPKNNKVVRKKV